MKIRCSNAADRDTLVVILARNGYTVRQVKEKAPGKGVSSYYVQVVEDGA